MVHLILHPLSTRVFISFALLLAMAVIIGFSALNYSVNDFGLWRSRDQVRIWKLEKTSKFLLAHRYIPENYPAILVGSSVSDNIDPRDISAIKLYNLSMAGGNMSEIGKAVRLYLARAKSPQIMVVNLHPYMLATTGAKSFQVHGKEYYGSLFSALPVIVWAYKIGNLVGIGGAEFDHSYAGWQNLERTTPKQALNLHPKEMLEDCRKENWQGDLIDPNAYQELDDVLKLARARGVQIIAYFHPYIKAQWDVYHACGKGPFFIQEMQKLFKSGEIAIDFNTPTYQAITAREDLRLDLAHMTNEGSTMIAKEIDKVLTARLLTRH